MQSITHTGDLLQAIWTPGPGELLLILAIVLVVFGANRIPQLGESLGKGIRNFKKSFSSDEIETQPTQHNVKEVADHTVEPLESRLGNTQESKTKI
ncbi:MAG: twin-arginine translocase TatA/TatE family subunit [Bradymonadia bacterium]